MLSIRTQIAAAKRKLRRLSEERERQLQLVNAGRITDLEYRVNCKLYEDVEVAVREDLARLTGST